MIPTTLITGGAGFIGSHLTELLVAAGEEVLCLDNFYTGTKDNIRHLLNCGRRIPELGVRHLGLRTRRE